MWEFVGINPVLGFQKSSCGLSNLLAGGSNARLLARGVNSYKMTIFQLDVFFGNPFKTGGVVKVFGKQFPIRGSLGFFLPKDELKLVVRS